ncbi:hypothetical protein BDV09DRAFT_197960 [Aspergillus tetrazonus]
MVISAGSSVIQVVPKIQPVVKSLISFNYSPTWITPQFTSHLTSAGRATTYTEAKKEKFRNNPDHLRQYRKQIDQTLNSQFPNSYKGSQEQKASRQTPLTLLVQVPSLSCVHSFLHRRD